MKFTRLSAKAKEAARDHEREFRYQDQDWWDYVFEDAVRMGALMGIEIGTETHRNMGGKEFQYPAIWFSGFSCQGDGACYDGRYWFKPDAPAKIRAEVVDEELLRIADELTALQIATKLTHNWTHSVRITTGSSNYSHSDTMEFEFSDYDGPDEETLDYTTTQDAIIQLLRDFADWIYRQLEAEYDHFTGDEAIDEYLKEGDLNFSSAGAIIPARTSI